MTYLSFAPEGLREAFITGGLSPIGRPVDDVYAATCGPLIEKNRAYFERYPDDRARVRRHPPPPRRRGRPAPVRRPAHRAPVPPARAVARRQRRASSCSTTSSSCRSARGPSCTTRRTACRSAGTRSTPRSTSRRYADGVPTRWSAERTMPDEVAERAATSRPSTSSPGCGRTTAGCSPHRAAAELLAEHPWPRLYDADRLAPQRGARRRDDLRQRPVRRAAFRGGDGRRDPGPAAVGSPTSTSTTACAPTASGSSAG